MKDEIQYVYRETHNVMYRGTVSAMGPMSTLKLAEDYFYRLRPDVTYFYDITGRAWNQDLDWKLDHKTLVFNVCYTVFFPN